MIWVGYDLMFIHYFQGNEKVCSIIRCRPSSKLKSPRHTTSGFKSSTREGEVFISCLMVNGLDIFVIFCAHDNVIFYYCPQRERLITEPELGSLTKTKTSTTHPSIGLL